MPITAMEDDVVEVLLDAATLLSFDVTLRPISKKLEPLDLHIFGVFRKAMQVVNQSGEVLRHNIKVRQKQFELGLRKPLLSVEVKGTVPGVGGAIDRDALIKALMATDTKYRGGSKQDQADAILEILNKK